MNPPMRIDPEQDISEIDFFDPTEFHSPAQPPIFFCRADSLESLLPNPSGQSFVILIRAVPTDHRFV